MKKLLDRCSAILEKEYHRHRDDFWTEESDPSITHIIHKKTGFLIVKSKFNTKNTLPKHGKIRYEINIKDL